MKKFRPKFAAKHAAHIVQQNSPTVLSAIAVVGVAATGYLAVKAGFDSAKKIEDDRYAKSVAREATKPPVELTPQEKALLVWKLYIPAVGVGALTIGCIVASNRIAVRRLATLAAAYGVLSGDFDEYRNKAAELLGDKKAKTIDDKMAEEKIHKNPPPVNSPQVLQPGEAWFQDLSSGQNFIATRDRIEKARNDFNWYLMNEGYADLNDWYSQLGIEGTNVGNQLGWREEAKVDVVFTPILLPDATTATGIALRPEPKPDFTSLH